MKLMKKFLFITVTITILFGGIHFVNHSAQIAGDEDWTGIHSVENIPTS